MAPEPSADMEMVGGLGGFPRPAVELARWTGVGLAAAMTFSATLLAWRWRVGALGGSDPLETPALVTAAVTIVVTVVVARLAWAWRLPSPDGRLRLDWLVGLGLTTATLIAAVVLTSVPGDPLGRAAFWCIVAVEEVWAWRPAVWRRMLARRSDRPASGSTESRPLTGGREHPAVEPLPAWDELPADEVTQQLTRRLAGDGCEILAGWLRVPLEAGQRSTSVHVAFCPPFRHLPTATLEQLEGPPARIKTVQLLPFGARFDLKLASQSESPATLLLRLSAQTRPTPESDLPDREGTS